MKLSIGIVGLPNVGKSTLFNAILKKQTAYVANYPFATIEPNIGIVEVPDERLPILAKVVNTQKIIPAVVEFYDIAGLVKGASKGEGLGNKFLSHIRETAAIVHVVRLFEDDNVIHVANKVDPISDVQTIETELIFADLETLKKQKEPGMNASKQDKVFYEIVKRLTTELNNGKAARNVVFNDEEKNLVKQLNLMTIKPQIYVFNVSEKQLENLQQTETLVKSAINQAQSNYIIFNAKLENDLLALSEAEQKEYLQQYHLDDTGLNRLIKKSYEILGLISFLTAGEKEVRAWTIEKGALAPQAAAVIHTDFEKNFIKADIVSYENFIKFSGWLGSREAGKVLSAGKEYIMKEGDIVEFKVGV